jgi:GH25 family lysozyme M1 (1,4-beta-N-acetylmuramidase)
MFKGIDVSSYQGNIDWTKVKPYIDFAIIRCGWGNDFKNQDDVYYEKNANRCKELNIPFGVYLYSYATNLDEARSEVEHTLRLIKDKKLEYPVFLDVEDKRQMALPKERLVEIVKYYCEQIEKNGYYVGIYSDLNRFKSNLDSKELERFDKWVAEYNDKLTYDKEVGMWQNTSYEELAGIYSRVDGDIALINYPKIIRDAGLNHLDTNKLKYNIGDKVYVSGKIYNDSDAQTVLKEVCNQEFTIEGIDKDKIAPYKISEGYVKEESVFLKCDN